MHHDPHGITSIAITMTTLPTPEIASGSRHSILSTASKSSVRNSRHSAKRSDAHAKSKEALRKIMKKCPRLPPVESTRIHGFRGFYRDRMVATPTEVRPRPLSLKDLECIRTLGQGSYGSVVLVRVRERPLPNRIERTGSVYAMKILNKAEAQSQAERHPDDVDVEIASLSQLPWNPFVNGVVSAFRDSANLYLMLECVPSGSLHEIIYKQGPLDAATARFYYCNIACALMFLHSHGLVHRDLKPTNILLKPDGYLALVDFGLSKLESDTLKNSWALVGTPIYMAPELVNPQKLVGRSVDWWASGVILYEMITKRVPFNGDEAVVFKRLESGRYKWPRHVRVGKSLKSFVSGLLTCEATERLGVASLVMEHPWLQAVDWDRIERQQYVAPYIPGTPHLLETWLDKPLPEPETVPMLRVVVPPVHRQHDHRQPVVREDMRENDKA